MGGDEVALMVPVSGGRCERGGEAITAQNQGPFKSEMLIGRRVKAAIIFFFGPCSAKTMEASATQSGKVYLFVVLRQIVPLFTQSMIRIESA